MSVATSMSIQDRMTAKLNKITAAFQKMTRASQAADQATKAVSPGQSFNRASSFIDRARKKISDFVSQQRQAAVGAEKVKNAWSGVAGMVKGAMAYLGVRRIVAGVKNMLSAYNLQNEAETKLDVVMRQRMGAGDEDFGAIMDLTARQQAGGVVGDEIQLMGAQQLSTFLTQRDALETLIPAMNNLAVQQNGVNVSSEAMVNIGNLMGKVMQGQTSALTRVGITFSAAQEEILKYGTEAERAATLAQVITDNVGEMNAAMLQTPQGALQQISNTWGDIKERIGGQLYPAVLRLFQTINQQLPTVEKLLAGAGFVISRIVGMIAFGIQIVGWFAGAVVEAWDIIGPILEAAALVTLGLMIRRLWEMIPPLLVQAAIWAIINWPILLIFAAIAAVIMIAKKMGLTFEDVCGFVGALLGGLYAFGYNLIADGWNLIASFAEFFANVFNDPIGSIQRLFVDLASGVLNTLHSVASAIDAVFGSSLTASVSGWQDNLKRWAAKNLSEPEVKVPRMEYLNVGDTAKIWGENGKTVLKSFSGAFDNLSAPTFSSSGIGVDLQEIENVGEVGKIKEDVNIAEEDLKFLRDVAEMRYVQNFVTLTPTVAVDAQVSEKVDLDEVLNRIESKLEDEFVMSAEGVYN